MLWEICLGQVEKHARLQKKKVENKSSLSYPVKTLNSDSVDKTKG